MRKSTCRIPLRWSNGVLSVTILDDRSVFSPAHEKSTLHTPKPRYLDEFFKILHSRSTATRSRKNSLMLAMVKARAKEPPASCGVGICCIWDLASTSPSLGRAVRTLYGRHCDETFDGRFSIKRNMQPICVKGILSLSFHRQSCCWMKQSSQRS